MENKKSIDLLNTLVEINSDRISGYETASSQTEELDLEELFAHLAATSKECRDHLVSEVLRLGGKPAQETDTAGKFFREWAEVKAALTGKDRKVILTRANLAKTLPFQLTRVR